MRSPRLCGVVNWIRGRTPHGSSRSRMSCRSGATHNPGFFSQGRSNRLRPGSGPAAQSLLPDLPAIPHALASLTLDIMRSAERSECSPHLDLGDIASHNPRLRIFGEGGEDAEDQLGVPLSSEPKRTLSPFLHGMGKNSPSVRDISRKISKPSRSEP